MENKLSKRELQKYTVVAIIYVFVGIKNLLLQLINSFPLKGGMAR